MADRPVTDRPVTDRPVTGAPVHVRPLRRGDDLAPSLDLAQRAFGTFSAADVRAALTRNGGSMADPGSVAYLFARKGVEIGRAHV